MVSCLGQVHVPCPCPATNMSASVAPIKALSRTFLDAVPSPSNFCLASAYKRSQVSVGSHKELVIPWKGAESSGLSLGKFGSPSGQGHPRNGPYGLRDFLNCKNNIDLTAVKTRIRPPPRPSVTEQWSQARRKAWTSAAEIPNGPSGRSTCQVAKLSTP